MSSLTTFVAGNVLTAAQLNNSFAAVGGLRAVDPTSVTVTGVGSSGTVGANGLVTFGTAASVSINGCFSSTFRNYLAVIDFDASTGVNMQVRMRAGGTDNTTANSYVRQRLEAGSTTVIGLRSTTNEWNIGSGSANLPNGSWVSFLRPFLASATAFEFVTLDSLSGAYYLTGVATHNQATSYDGFSFYPTTGSISGTVTVYGLFG